MGGVCRVIGGAFDDVEVLRSIALLATAAYPSPPEKEVDRAGEGAAEKSNPCV